MLSLLQVLNNMTCVIVCVHSATIYKKANVDIHREKTLHTYDSNNQYYSINMLDNGICLVVCVHSTTNNNIKANVDIHRTRHAHI